MFLRKENILLCTENYYSISLEVWLLLLYFFLHSQKLNIAIPSVCVCVRVLEVFMYLFCAALLINWYLWYYFFVKSANHFIILYYINNQEVAVFLDNNKYCHIWLLFIQNSSTIFFKLCVIDVYIYIYIYTINWTISLCVSVCLCVTIFTVILV